MSYCQDCADRDKKIEALQERIRLEEVRIKGITARADKYAIELHALKNQKPSPGPMGANEQ